MRKWAVPSLITALFLSIITTSQASFDSIMLADYPRDTILYKMIKNEPAISHIEQMVVLPKSPFNQHEAANIIRRMANLPKPLLNDINKQKIILKLFTGSLTSNPTAKHLAGVVPRGYPADTTWDDVPGIGGSKVVLVKIGASDKGQGHGSVNLELHEIAHTIDRHILYNISQSPEFKSIWEQERGYLFPGNAYFIMHSEEYFAESFALFYLNKETNQLLRKKAPHTYYLIDKLH